MAFDPLSPLAAARVRCLLLPCGQITRSRFLELVKRFQEVSMVKLADVSSLEQPSENMFSPLAFPAGSLLFDFTVSTSSPAQRALYPFELYREPFVVIGIVDGNEYGFTRNDSDTKDDEPKIDSEALLMELSEALNSLRAWYTVALVHHIILFDVDRSIGAYNEAFTLIPSAPTTQQMALKTAMNDVSALLLAEMATYAKSIQALPGIETPRQVMPEGFTSPPMENEPDPLPAKGQSWLSGVTAQRAVSPAGGLRGLRNSLPSHLFSPNPSSACDSDTASIPDSATSTTFDQMKLQPTPRPKAVPAQNDPRTSSTDRFSLQAFGSGTLAERSRTQGRGRVGVIIGMMYLMAGRWPDAVRELGDAGNIARGTNDHVWHAKALDGILVALLMCAWASVDFEIPQLCHISVDRSNGIIAKAAKNIAPAASPMPVDISSFQPASSLALRESMKNLTAFLPDLVNAIIRLYTRTTAEQVSQIVLSETILRLTKILSILRVAERPLTQAMLQSLVFNQPILPEPDDVDAETLILHLNKSDIAALAMSSIPPVEIEQLLDFPDRMVFYTGLAAVLTLLGYHRKRAFILREIIAYLLPALAASSGQGQNGRPDLGAHLVSLLGSDKPTGKTDEKLEQSLTVRVTDFLQLLCRVYGAIVTEPIEQNFDKSGSEGDSKPVIDGDASAIMSLRIQSESAVRNFGSSYLKLDILNLCIGVCEVVPDVRGMVQFASNMLRNAGSGIAPAPAQRDVPPSISLENQRRLLDTMSSAMLMSKQFGVEEVGGEYWDDFMIRDINILPSSADTAIIPRRRADLGLDDKTIRKETKGPFIVNRFSNRPAAAAKDTVLVAEEKATFAVLLQNLYDFNLEIDFLELVCEGVIVKASIQNFYVGPYTTQRYRIYAVPESSGQIIITGCMVKVKNCAAQFHPAFHDAWRPISEMKLKKMGLDATAFAGRPSSVASETGKAVGKAMPHAMTAKAKIIGPQPFLTFKAISLHQGNLIINDGEIRRFTVTVENTSTIPIDLVTVTFDDTTLQMLRSAVENKELPAVDLYEVEYGIYKKPALTWARSAEELSLQPTESCKLEIEVLGKPGLQSAEIQIEYGHIAGIPPEESQIYTRSLSIPFNVTPNASVDMIRNDILSMSGVLLRSARDATKPIKEGDDNYGTEPFVQRLLPQMREKLKIHDDKDYCLLVLDFYNSAPRPMEILPQIRVSGDHDDDDEDDENDKMWENIFDLKQTADPGETTRAIIPFPRILIEKPHAPIPSLNPSSRRQFVVSTSKVTEDYEKFSRECFWHREEILKRLRVSWRDPHFRRHGSVELRSLRLTARMLEALKAEDLDIAMRVFDNNDQPVKMVGTTFGVASNEFMVFKVTVKNNLSRQLRSVLRIQPCLRNQPYNIALDISKKFAFNGLLQQPLPAIEPGETHEVEIGMVFLCAGDFEFGACLEEIRPHKGANGLVDNKKRKMSVELDILAAAQNTERRTWYAREPCKVDVFDEDDNDQAAT